MLGHFSDHNKACDFSRELFTFLLEKKGDAIENPYKKTLKYVKNEKI